MEDKNLKVKNWWNENPFTYSKGEGVENIDENNLSIEFFDKCESKFRMHGVTYQDMNKPLLSNFIEYDDIKGKNVLDIASGTGIISVEFSRSKANLTAIDLTPKALEMTKKNLQLRSLLGKVYEMDAQNMKFKNNSFDYVCAHGCLMHMPSIDKAIKEIYRVMSKDAKVYAWIYNKGWYFWFGIIFLRGLLLLNLFKYKFNITKLTSRYTDGYKIGGNEHTKFFSKKEMKNKFIKAGFQNVKTFVLYNPIEFESFPTKSFSFGQLFPNFIKSFLGKIFGLGLVIIASK